MKALFIWLFAVTVYCVGTQNTYATEYDRQGYGMRPTGSGTYQFSPLVDLMRNNHQHTPLLDRMARENRTPTADARMDVSKQGSDLIVGQRGKFQPPGAKDPVVVDVTAKVVKNPAFATAVSKFARALPYAGTVFTLYDLFSGWDIGHEVEGNQHIYYRLVRDYPSYCRTDQGFNGCSGNYSSPELACNAGARQCSNNGTTYNCVVSVGGPHETQTDALQCVTTFSSIDGSSAAPAPQVRDYARGQGQPDMVKMPLSDSQLADAVMDSSGWDDPKWDEVVRDMLDSGQKVPVEDVEVTGPSQAPGPTTTRTETSQGANGQTVVRLTTTTTNNTINYSGDTINITTVTNTTVRNENNEVISESEETTEPETPSEEAASDTSLPPVPDLYEQKYPDGLVGVWESRKAELTASSLMALLAQLMPSIAPGGTCPQWLIAVDVGVANFGTHDVSPPCSIWPILASIVIVSALLLARRLVFGG